MVIIRRKEISYKVNVNEVYDRIWSKTCAVSTSCLLVACQPGPPELSDGSFPCPLVAGSVPSVLRLFLDFSFSRFVSSSCHSPSTEDSLKARFEDVLVEAFANTLTRQGVPLVGLRRQSRASSWHQLLSTASRCHKQASLRQRLVHRVTSICGQSKYEQGIKGQACSVQTYFWNAARK